MKRIIILFSTVLLMVFSAGCGEQEVDVEKENKDESQTEDVEEETSEEDDKEDPIEVEIEANPVIEKGKVYIEGETNIPDHAELMFTISNDEYKGQSTEVVEGGKFKTETFTDDGDSLPVGEYELSISLSVPNTQDDKFVKVVGEEYENLTGDLMEESDLGKSMSYSMTFDIDEGEGAAKDEKEQEEEEEQDIPKEYESALRKADSYANTMHMSKKGLYNQLTSEHGENFSEEAAEYAVDNIEADWNENALQKAISYQDNMAMSPNAIYDQLVSEHGEQFTEKQAQYAIDNLPK